MPVDSTLSSGSSEFRRRSAMRFLGSPFDDVNEMYDCISSSFHSSSLEMYQLGINGSNQLQLQESHPIASYIVDRLMSLGGDMLFALYLDSKQDAHVIQRSLGLIEHVCCQNFISHDECVSIDEDAEPAVPRAETRRVMDAPVTHRTIQLNSMILRSHTLLSEGCTPRRRPSAQRSERSKKSKGAGDTLEGSFKKISSPQGGSHSNAVTQSIFTSPLDFPEFKPKLQSIRQDALLDRVEEQLRMLKQREQELRSQKESMDTARQIEQKEQLHRVRQARQQNHSDDFTFDFNGLVLPVERVNIDKFPPTTMFVSHAVSNGLQPTTAAISSVKPPTIVTTEAANQKLKVAQMLKAEAEKQKEAVFQFRPSADTFEKFAASKGVTYIEGQKAKQGALFQADVSKLDFMSKKTGGLMITKDQYHNLFGHEAQLSTPRHSVRAGGGGEEEESGFSSSRLPRIATEQSQGKSVRMRTLIESARQSSLPKLHSRRTISDKIIVQQSSEFAKKLLGRSDNQQEEENEVARPFLTARKEKTKKYVSMSSPNDLFNSAILSRKAVWGNIMQTEPAPSLSSGLSTKSLKTSQDYREKHTIGNISQFPRERLSKASMARQNYTHLASPKVGHTMGHGYVGESFNPSRLLKTEGVAAAGMNLLDSYEIE